MGYTHFRGLHPRLLKLRPFGAGSYPYCLSLACDHFRGLHPLPWVAPTVINITPLRGWELPLLPFRGLRPLSVGFTHFRGLHPRLLILCPFGAGGYPYCLSVACDHFRGLHPLPWVAPTVINIMPLRGWGLPLLPFRGLRPLPWASPTSVGCTHGY